MDEVLGHLGELKRVTSIARSVSNAAYIDDCKITSPSALRRLVSAEIDTPLEEQRGAI